MPPEISPQMQENLEAYLALLRKWQKAVNLVAPSTLDHAWERHFEDSLSLAALIPEGATVFDLGSGAGFPGLVLAIARPDLKVTLIESDTKKCTFLSTVSRETKTSVTIWNQRIENVSRETIPAVITARALAPLDKLLGYCLPWAEANPALVLLFLKGEKAQAEIDAARRHYLFDLEIRAAQTGEGKILKISGLKTMDKQR